MDFKKDFGAKLKEYRISRNMTQEKFAAKIGIAVPTLSGFENGKSFPSYLVLCKIIETLNVTPETLFTYNTYLNIIEDKEIELKILNQFKLLTTKNRNLVFQIIQCFLNNQ